MRVSKRVSRALPDSHALPRFRDTGGARTGGAPATHPSVLPSIYQDVWGDLKITDRRDASVLGIKASGWTDTVVWNPFKESMGASKFVCVECAKAAQPVAKPPRTQGGEAAGAFTRAQDQTREPGKQHSDVAWRPGETEGLRDAVPWRADETGALAPSL